MSILRNTGKIDGMSIGENIKKCRKHLKWTLDDLEEYSGVKRGTISALECRGSERSTMLVPIAKAFGLTVEELTRGDLPRADSKSKNVTYVAETTAHYLSNDIDKNTILNAYAIGDEFDKKLLLDTAKNILERHRKLQTGTA